MWEIPYIIKNWYTNLYKIDIFVSFVIHLVNAVIRFNEVVRKMQRWEKCVHQKRVHKINPFNGSLAILFDFIAWSHSTPSVVVRRFIITAVVVFIFVSAYIIFFSLLLDLIALVLRVYKFRHCWCHFLM